MSVGLSKCPSALPPVFVPVGDDEPVFLTRDSFQKCNRFSGRDRVGYLEIYLLLYYLNSGFKVIKMCKNMLLASAECTLRYGCSLTAGPSILQQCVRLQAVRNTQLCQSVCVYRESQFAKVPKRQGLCTHEISVSAEILPGKSTGTHSSVRLGSGPAAIYSVLIQFSQHQVLALFRVGAT